MLGGNKSLRSGWMEIVPDLKTIAAETPNSFSDLIPSVSESVSSRTGSNRIPYPWPGQRQTRNVSRLESSLSAACDLGHAFRCAFLRAGLLTPVLINTEPCGVPFVFNSETVFASVTLGSVPEQSLLLFQLERLSLTMSKSPAIKLLALAKYDGISEKNRVPSL